MAKINFKIFSTILAVSFSLSACGSNVTETLPELETTDSQISTFATDSPTIIDQIKNSTLEQNEWGIAVRSLPNPGQPKKATLLSYIAYDNDKGSYRDELRPTLNMHEMAGSNNLLNIVLQTDSADSGDMKRYYVVNDNDQSKIVSPYTKFKYERNSGDYRVLQAFTRWGFSTYKSQLRLLDINNHGGAFRGIAKDDTSGGVISLPNLARAIQNSAGHVDLLNMDACLMGTMEVIYELKDLADVLIGSEDSTLGTGMLYSK